MRKFVFPIYAPDAENALQTVRSFDAVADYGRFVPEYDADHSKLTVHLDIPRTEELCYEEVLKRTLHLVNSRHQPQEAPEELRCRR